MSSSNYKADNLLSLRQDLTESLDQLVNAEEAFQQEHGHYTRILSNLSFTLPQKLLEKYAIYVEDATKDTLEIVAMSERDGKAEEYLGIDQNHQIRGNFPLPAPRVDYLRQIAVTHMKKMKERRPAQVFPTQMASNSSIPALEGAVYRGFFKYELREEGDARYTVAVGIKAPVAGLEVGADDHFAEDDIESRRVLAEILPQLPQLTHYQTGQKGDLEIEPISVYSSKGK